MNDERVVALRLALRAVISAACVKGLDADELCETAMRSILDGAAYEPSQIADAMVAIEVAADALDWPLPAVG